MYNLYKMTEGGYKSYMTISKTSILVMLIVICYQQRMQKLSNYQNYPNKYYNNSVGQLYYIYNLCKMIN